MKTHAQQIEEWRPVVGYEGLYEVSNLARIRSLDRVIERSKSANGRGDLPLKGKMMKLTMGMKGYLVVSFSKNGKRKQLKIHRIVALAFVPLRQGKNTVNHKRGIKTDNLPDKIEWCTDLENTEHAFRTGLMKPPDHGEKSNLSKLTDSKVLEIRKLYDENRETKNELAKKFKVTYSNIHYIVKGITWKHLL